MTNADKFKEIFGIYATELWAKPEEELLAWLNADVPDTNVGDTISRQAAIDKFIDDLEEIFSRIRERHIDESCCGLCEYDAAYMGQRGDWCNECPGFNRDDCFKLSNKIRKKWKAQLLEKRTTKGTAPDLISIQAAIAIIKDCAEMEAEE